MAVVEEWRPVVGYEGRYEVSNHGRVRSLLWAAPKILKPSASGRNGYWTVELTLPGKPPKARRVHHLVLSAFVGPKPAGMGGAHGDRDKANNRLSNLAWKTQLGNMADREAHGTTARGLRNGKTKITPETAIAIRDSSLSAIAAAKKFGTTPGNVWSIRARKTWAHV